MHTDETKILPFEKWHGTGNDFILCSEQRALDFSPDVPSTARRACDRHFGIGADGLILIGRSDDADFRMRMWNPDGGEAEMCANGLRCVGMHLLEHGLSDGSAPIRVETMRRTVVLEFVPVPSWHEGRTWVRVNMGIPVTDRRAIPVGGEGASPVIEEELAVPGIDESLRYTAVNFGNPHAVIFVDDVGGVPLEAWGPAIENHTDLFPDRINVEFVQVIERDHVRMRVWERGAGITLSCGSGTAAVQAACRLTGKAGDRLRIDVPGGSLMTECTPEGAVYLSGPAVHVFTGEWPE